MDFDATPEEKLAAIDHELNQIDAKITKLKEEREDLIRRREEVKQLIIKRKREQTSNRDWSSRTFPWSNKVDSLLKEIFCMSEFRPMQLEAINATLAKEDAILIMPTGSGKSLCYQLPALVDDGITLVVSPLVSLMEDQMMGLKKINYPALMLSAKSSREELKLVTDALQNPKAKEKLIYVTPEKLAKSKRFMSQLQKCSAQGRFSRLAIDEVHCCSVWGHDFRPDYNYLGILKDMFPKTPLLGLTATSTSKVTADVQNMLNVQGCLVLKSTFNRPNLLYEVMLKPAAQEECLDLLEDWLKNRFKNQTGIIYSTTVKDCEELTEGLRARGLRVGIYHAVLEPEIRTKMHTRWMKGELQAVVATIAFGLGIDKPDVRFVIHHSLSKSMENFYQESGRAGRDGKRAECIVLFRLADYFKLSTMVFTQKTGLTNLYGMLNYCLDSHRCRRSMIAEHFDEVFQSASCNNMCDHCKKPRGIREFDATEHCRSLLKIINHAAEHDSKLTVLQLIDAWYGKRTAKMPAIEVKRPTCDRTTAEKIVGYLLIEGYLREDFHYTAYSTISYIKKGPRHSLLGDSKHRIILNFRGAAISENSSPNVIDKKSPKEKSDKSPAVSKSNKRLIEVDLAEQIFSVSSSDDEITALDNDSGEPLPKKKVDTSKKSASDKKKPRNS